MLCYELLENTDEYVSYRYFPEGKLPFGIIGVRKNDKAIIKQLVPPNDEFKWYFSHMYKRVKQFVDDDNYRSSGIIAWY